VDNAPLVGAFLLWPKHMSWYRYDPTGARLTLTLHIQPGAKKTEVAGLHGNALKIRVAAPPVEGAANEVLLKFVARLFAVPARQVSLVSGATSRHKVLEILNPVVPADQVSKRITD
jgi:uncharacterized protein